MQSKWTSVALWLGAFVVTVLLAYFQRMTGPSYPLRGTLQAADGAAVDYGLPRSDQGRGRLRVRLPIDTPTDEWQLEWRRYPTNEAYRTIPMTGSPDGGIEAVIPSQPPAGKVEYRIVRRSGGAAELVPADETVIARYRGDVPAWVLIPHILCMFGGMLVATRALFEVLRTGRKGSGLVVSVMILLGFGGLFLGPVVQKFAFGAFWTGWPLGHDLTDNKTLIAVLAWLPATVAALAGRRLRALVLVGWFVMMGVFLIPHSLRGSELDWSQVEGAPEPASKVAEPTR
ncbi:MAG: hypothetical protein PVG92_00845 [Holophagae bacterium]|jgi:hypothetical protein